MSAKQLKKLIDDCTQKAISDLLAYPDAVQKSVQVFVSEAIKDEFANRVRDQVKKALTDDVSKSDDAA